MGTKDNSTFMARYSAFSPYRITRREMGFGTPIGAGDAMAKSLYCGMKAIATWDCEQASALPTGGVFNLEFSPEGSLLVAACEKKSIQIFDPLTHQRIHSVNGAHSDCVNCVKFLDGRMFATCSDDTTIALWDVRNLKKKIRSLLGHSNWVKNIEFSVKDKLLVTSGLDGSIYTWDINSYTEYNLVYQRVFHASGLMRCRLSPDAKQMVMCTTGGLLVIIHDLNLSTLAQDLHGFKPNLYRLMQMSQQVIPIAAMYDHLFDRSRKENRVEFVSDFPEGNDAEVVSALQIHPQGWSALSRNISHDDRSEWSCIHDIQPLDERSSKSCRDSLEAISLDVRRPLVRRLARRRPRPYRAPRPAAAASTSATASTESVMNNNDSTPSQSQEREREGEPARPEEEEERERETRPRAEVSRPSSSGASRQAGGAGQSIQNDVWEASITIKQHRILQELYSRGQVGRNFNMQRIMGINTGISPPAPSTAPSASVAPSTATRPHDRSSSTSTSSSSPSSSSSSSNNNTPSSSGQWPPARGRGGGGAGGGGECLSCPPADPRPAIRENSDRLLYYTEETNEGKGFIKELCFSSDGRIVCSPFGCGMRIFALNEYCSELSQCVGTGHKPRQLLGLGQSLGIHQDLVVSSKFSPRYNLLVTGCLEGRIVWYAPYSGEKLN